MPEVESNFQRFARAVSSGQQMEPSYRHAAKLQKVIDLAVVSDGKLQEMATA